MGTDTAKNIMDFLDKNDWPATTEEIAKEVKISWNTAQVHLFRLVSEGKLKYKKVGRQNQWWLEKSYKKNF